MQFSNVLSQNGLGSPVRVFEHLGVHMVDNRAGAWICHREIGADITETENS